MHTYYLNDTRILAEEWGDKLLIYLYDAEGDPIGMQYRTTGMVADDFYTYWFEKDLQGDIIGVYTDKGRKICSYAYDAWGNFKVIMDYDSGVGSGDAQAVGYNPFHYRGYYYDQELGMYYLQSRYYDPVICRFINADACLYNNILGFNMYAYCGSNSVNYIDPYGEFATSVLEWWSSIMWGPAIVEPTFIGEAIYAVGCIVFGGVAIVETVFAIDRAVDVVANVFYDEAPHSIGEGNIDRPIDGNGKPVVTPGDPPREEDGYHAPKNGPRKGKTTDGKKGWIDNNGNIWVPAPTGSNNAHGGGHWDVNRPDGKGYVNVYPGGKIRPGGGKFPIF